MRGPGDMGSINMVPLFRTMIVHLTVSGVQGLNPLMLKGVNQMPSGKHAHRFIKSSKLNLKQHDNFIKFAMFSYLKFTILYRFLFLDFKSLSVILLLLHFICVMCFYINHIALRSNCLVLASFKLYAIFSVAFILLKLL